MSSYYNGATGSSYSNQSFQSRSRDNYLLEELRAIIHEQSCKMDRVIERMEEGTNKCTVIMHVNIMHVIGYRN